MRKNKSSISKSTTDLEIGEYWDQHDLTDVWGQTESVDFEVDIQSQRIYFPIDRELTDKILRIAKVRGITPETLVNLWIQEKANQPANSEGRHS
jgi:hypothetical protein